MTHAGDRLSAYLDGELNPAEQTSIESHLADCASCRSERDAAGASRSLVRSLPVVEPPPDVFDLPAEVIEFPGRWRRRLVAAAAAATLIVGVGFGVNADRAVPLQLDDVVDQHVARASIDRGFNVLQVQAVVNR